MNSDLDGSLGSRYFLNGANDVLHRAQLIKPNYLTPRCLQIQMN